MSPRPSLRDHSVRSMPPHQGREAIYRPGGPSQTEPESATWDKAHRRVTFYCPVEMVAALQAEMLRSGRSKTAVIVDALRAHLKASARRR